jgi:hypothetical protein
MQLASRNSKVCNRPFRLSEQVSLTSDITQETTYGLVVAGVSSPQTLLGYIQYKFKGNERRLEKLNRQLHSFCYVQCRKGTWKDDMIVPRLLADDTKEP